MQSSQLLPPQPAGPADVAAALPTGRESAPEAGEGSFGAVLESRMNAAATPGAAPEAVATAGGDPQAAAMAALAAQAPGDAVLASLMAGLAGSTPVVMAPVAMRPVDSQDIARESATAAPVGAGLASARNLLAEAMPGPERATQAGAEPAAGASGAGAQAFARLLPAASGAFHPGAPAMATPLEATTLSPAPDLATSAGRTVPEAVPRADALPGMAAASGDAPAEAAPLPRVPVSAGFGTPGWNGAFADRVTWIAQARQPSAELTLNPPQLGPVEVRVSVSADQQATLSFHSPHPAVREAIQGSLPRLQEAFAASGLQLGDVFVGSGPAGFGRDQGQSREGSGEPGRRSGGQGGVSVTTGAAPVSWLRGGSLGQVDLFA